MIQDGAALSRELFGEALDPAEYLRRFYPKATIPPTDHAVLTAVPLVASINHGHWVAACPCGARGLPAPGCVVFLDVLLGWCVQCSNQAIGRGWRPIVVPPIEKRRRIEAVLACRPRVEDRNWESYETVEDLLAQNRAHGDPVADLGDDPPSVPAAKPWPFPPPSAMAAVLGRTLRRGRLARLGLRR